MDEEFDWDAANISHLARHNIAPREAEEALLDPNAVLLEMQLDSGEERIEAVGMTVTGRILAVIFTMRGLAVRPVTAYAAPAGLQALYLNRRAI